MAMCPNIKCRRGPTSHEWDHELCNEPGLVVPDDLERVMTGDDRIEEALRELGLPVTDTMGRQLVVFVRAMKIFEERTAELGGELWKEVDTEDTAHHIRHKAQRLYHREGTGNFDPDDPLDLINYAAFYIRQKEEG